MDDQTQLERVREMAREELKWPWDRDVANVKPDWPDGSSVFRHSDFNLDTQRWERWRPPLPKWATIIDCGAWT